MFLWGAGWSALKVLTLELSMEIIVFWRFFFMTLAFIPILFYMKKPISLNQKSTLFILSSSLLNISFMVSSFYGIKYGLAGSGGVIITTLTPIMTFLAVAIIFRKKIDSIQSIGLFIGLIGGVILLQLNSLSLFLNDSNLYFLLCAILWAGVTILAQHSQKHIDPIHYSFAIAVISTIVTFIYATCSIDTEIAVVFNQGSKFWIAMIYLAVFGQAIATTIFFISSAKLGSQTTSSFMFLVPIFALLVAWALLGEPLESHILVGGVVSIVALYFINKRSEISS